MNRQEFREICRARRLCWGTVLLEHMTPQVVRSVARAGFDWIWIDNEHGHHAYETIYHVARTAEDLGVITMHRIPQAEYPLIAQALVAEALDFHIPKGYIYFAMAFSVFVELSNHQVRQRHVEPVHLRRIMNRRRSP